MKYMIRETYTCQRGKVPELIESFKSGIEGMKSQGITYHKLLVDISGRMDTLYHEYEVDSVDKYFESERGFYVNMDSDNRRMIDHFNALTLSGHREIYEVLM